MKVCGRILLWDILLSLGNYHLAGIFLYDVPWQQLSLIVLYLLTSESLHNPPLSKQIFNRLAYNYITLNIEPAVILYYWHRQLIVALSDVIGRLNVQAWVLLLLRAFPRNVPQHTHTNCSGVTTRRLQPNLLIALCSNLQRYLRPTY